MVPTLPCTILDLYFCILGKAQEVLVVWNKIVKVEGGNSTFNPLNSNFIPNSLTHLVSFKVQEVIGLVQESCWKMKNYRLHKNVFHFANQKEKT